MLRLDAISLFQFKNYAQQRFPFKKRLIGICGNNGVGKTNLLDAIYYLCFTKSYFTRNDSQNVLTGAMGFRLEGQFIKNDEAVNLVCVLRETGKKEFTNDGEVYNRLASHVGKYPAVIITPDDVQIITGGSEERRRFLDALFSQVDTQYLQHLIDYNKVLQQRNGYLKMIAEKKIQPDSLLDVYDRQLAGPGTFIYEQRRNFIADLIPVATRYYADIAGSDEDLQLKYQSHLHDNNYNALLTSLREKDRVLQRTNGGIHKDDLDITLNGQPFKTIASQGQRKSLLFALKLAEFDLLKSTKGFAPILLLDDVFEKLDAGRMSNLLFKVCKQNDGQVFITDTHVERIIEHFEALEEDYEIVEV